MSISRNTTSDNRSVTISISDRFDFSLHQDFRDSYRDMKEGGTRFALDLRNACYMDSSALGMILLLKDHAESIGGELVIQKPNEVIRKILDIAKFDRFVTIEE